MGALSTHWTEWNTANFQYAIAADFARQIEKSMARQGISQTVLAKRLNVSDGRVSQVLNNPGNLTLRNIVEYSRAVDHKVSIVTYYDNDPGNLNGPIDSEIFSTCWAWAGRPTDFFELQACTTSAIVVTATRNSIQSDPSISGSFSGQANSTCTNVFDSSGAAYSAGGVYSSGTFNGVLTCGISGIFMAGSTEVGYAGGSTLCVMSNALIGTMSACLGALSTVHVAAVQNLLCASDQVTTEQGQQPAFSAVNRKIATIQEREVYQQAA